MKRLVIMMTCLFLLIAPAAWRASAVELALNSITVEWGGSAELELTLADTTGSYAAVNATLTLPVGVTLTGITKGDLLTEQFRLGYASDANAVLAYSAIDTTNAAGNLLKIQVLVAVGAPTGTYPITIARSGLSNADGSVSVAHDRIAGTLTITAWPITVKKAGTGNGTLTIGALICDESCQEITVPYVEGAQYSVSVEPDQYSHFIEWRDASGAWIENLFYAQPGDTVYAVFEQH